MEQRTFEAWCEKRAAERLKALERKKTAMGLGEVLDKEKLFLYLRNMEEEIDSLREDLWQKRDRDNAD